MKPITYHVHAKIFESNGRLALLLLNDKPDSFSDYSCYLRFPFVLQGPESLLFPTFILDDWGSEIRGTAVYEWVREYGSQFPRAEVFGLDDNGRESQRFMRELDLFTPLPCYACQDKNLPVQAASLVETILLPGEGSPAPVKIKRPSALPHPIRSARVRWWQVQPGINEWGFPPEYA